MPIKIAPEVEGVLRRSAVDGDLLVLPDEQLDRKLYTDVNKVLTALGGKWNRGRKGHVFPQDADPMTALDAALGLGQVEKASHSGFFPTPPDVIDRLLFLAEVEPGHAVLEPSAGDGAIARRLADIVGLSVRAVELRPDNAKKLRTLDLGAVHEGDFLAFNPTERFDRIVMNPPFERCADAAHVKHAFRLLAPGGRLVSVVGRSATGRTTRKEYVAFQALIEKHGWFEDLPEGSFKASGTGVSTSIVVLLAAATSRAKSDTPDDA